MLTVCCVLHRSSCSTQGKEGEALPLETTLHSHHLPAKHMPSRLCLTNTSRNTSMLPSEYSQTRYYPCSLLSVNAVRQAGVGWASGPMCCCCRFTSLVLEMFFWLESAFSSESLMVYVQPLCLLHALSRLTSVCTLTIPNIGSHTSVWTHENAAHTGSERCVAIHVPGKLKSHAHNSSPEK